MTVDEVSEEQKKYDSSRLSSRSTSSRLSAPHRHIHPRDRDDMPEGEEQQTVSSPTVWSPEPPEQGTGEARNPLLRRPQWKLHNEQGQQK